MTLPLRPGDPLPKLPTSLGVWQAEAFAGRWLVLLVGGPEVAAALAGVPDDGEVALRGIVAPDGRGTPVRATDRVADDLGRTSTQRLGALNDDGTVAAMAVAVDPRGAVAGVWSDGPAVRVLDQALQAVRRLLGRAG